MQNRRRIISIVEETIKMPLHYAHENEYIGIGIYRYRYHKFNLVKFDENTIFLKLFLYMTISILLLIIMFY